MLPIARIGKTVPQEPVALDPSPGVTLPGSSSAILTAMRPAKPGTWPSARTLRGGALPLTGSRAITRGRLPRHCEERSDAAIHAAVERPHGSPRFARDDGLKAGDEGGGRSSRAGEAGFTLVELLVVLVILGLVMGLVGPRVLGYLSSSRERTMRLQIESFGSALDLYYLDMGRYPTNAEGLEALIKAPAGGASRWAGPYLKQPKVPDDPWGNPYQYHVPGKAAPYMIVSVGPDGKGAAPGQQADSR